MGRCRLPEQQGRTQGRDRLARHEDHIKDSDAATIQKNKEILTALWTQIANAFIDYDEHLLFAGLNEPNAEDQAATDNLIQYNQTFVDAVRATGGNNAKRILVVQGPSTNIEHTCNYMAGKMPTDIVEGKLAIEVHYYNPWQFWGMEKDESWGKVFYYWGEGNHFEGSAHNANWGEEDEMRRQMLMMKTNFIDQGYPVVIGEFGANWRDLSSLPNESQEHHNASIKSHYRFFHELCKAMGSVVPMTWDVNYHRPQRAFRLRRLCPRRHQRSLSPLIRDIHRPDYGFRETERRHLHPSRHAPHQRPHLPRHLHHQRPQICEITHPDN